MFGFLNGFGKNKKLDEIVQSIQMNFSNNYKDAAQLNLKEFENTLEQLENENKLSDKQKVYYREKLAAFKEEMKNFTHKDQKPTWV